MRCLLLLLFLAPLARADERFDANLQAFVSVKGFLGTPGAKSRILAAVDALVEIGDARGSGPLARYLVETFASEAKLREELKKNQQRGADARAAMLVLDKEVAYLKRKVDAGDRSVVPDIQKRLEKRDAAARVFDEVIARSKSMYRLLLFHSQLRDTLGKSVAKLLAGAKDKPLAAALAELRTIFDVVDREQALVLVGILRDSGRHECAPHLVDLVDHPKADQAVRRAAVLALGRVRSADVYRSLLTIAARHEKLRASVLHSLSLAAETRLLDLDAAKAWVAKQK